MHIPEPIIPQEHKKDTAETPLVRVEKVIHASAKIIFDAWRNEDAIMEWWGPKGYRCPVAKIDFTRGGEYFFGMQKEGSDKIIYSGGRIEQIRADAKMILTDHPVNDQGERISAKEAGFEGPWAEIGESYITVELKVIGDSETELTLSHEGLPARIHDDCVQGWSSSLEKLKAWAEKQESKLIPH